MYYEEPDWTEPHKFRYRYGVEFNARVINVNKQENKFTASDDYIWELVRIDDPRIVFQLDNKDFRKMFEMSSNEEMVEIPRKVLDAINVVSDYFGYHDYSGTLIK